MRHIRVLLILVAVAVAAGLFAFYSSRPPQTGSPSEQIAGQKASQEPAGAQVTSRQPEPQAEQAAPTAESEKSEAPLKPPPQDFGRVVPVKADASPQAAAVSEALKKKDHPERLSALLPAKPFDKAAFEANPNAYLNTVEPGRCFLCAQPGKDVPALAAKTPGMSRIKQGESVKLSVKGAPLAPVSFTSFDLGTFAESKLNCVTVRADKDGVASVTFVATPGALNDCNILAGSPLASGQARFVVEISEAK